MATIAETNTQQGNTQQGSNQPIEPIENLLIIGGEKGGVGKSYTTNNLIGTIIRRKWENKITVFDADPSIDDVYQVYQKKDWMKKIEFSDNKYRMDSPFDIYVESKNKELVIVNLPSNVQKNFENFFETFGLFEPDIREKIYKTAYYLFVSDGSHQSIKLFRRHLQKYKNKPFIKTILMLNEGQNGQSESFSYLETINLESCRGFIKDVNDFKIPVLILPEMYSRLRYYIDELFSENQVSYEEIINGNHLNMLLCATYKQYISKVDKVFDQLFSKTGEITYQSLEQKQAKQRSETSLPLKSQS